MHDDYVDVLGLKRTDEALLYGGGIMPALKATCGRLQVARRGSDLTRLVREGASFDRIVVTRGIEISDVGLRKLFSMNRGLICFMLEGEDEAGLRGYLDSNHPWAEVWSWGTNVGRALVTTARGAPEWLD